jgi:multidrug resistance efflux pump
MWMKRIYQVKDGDRVTFTVDAFPDLQFSGKLPK